MSDRRVRYAFILLILAFPMSIDIVGGATEQYPEARTTPTGATARASFDPYGSWRVHATQAVLIAGLLIAGRERLRLEAKLGHARD